MAENSEPFRYQDELNAAKLREQETIEREVSFSEFKKGEMKRIKGYGVLYSGCLPDGKFMITFQNETTTGNWTSFPLIFQKDEEIKFMKLKLVAKKVSNNSIELGELK